jgi:hypothetical protein
MRERHDIEMEMAAVRADLEDSLARLRRTIRAKIDIPARVRRAIVMRMQRAAAFARQGADSARRLAQRTGDAVRAQPIAFAAIIGTLMMATVATLFLVRRRRRLWTW